VTDEQCFETLQMVCVGVMSALEGIRLANPMFFRNKDLSEYMDLQKNVIELQKKAKLKKTFPRREKSEGLIVELLAFMDGLTERRDAV
jgi:hypothetical protein